MALHTSLLALPDLLMQGRGAQRNAAESLMVMHQAREDARVAAAAMARASRPAQLRRVSQR